MNDSGALEIEVTATSADSTLSKMVELVRTSDQATSSTQQFIDRFQRWYVPAVVFGVIVTLFVSMSVFGQAFADGFYLAMTIFVAASPCALAIATPVTVLVGFARAAHVGVLVKGGAPLETLGRVKAMGFDKTDTLLGHLGNALRRGCRAGPHPRRSGVAQRPPTRHRDCPRPA